MNVRQAVFRRRFPTNLLIGPITYESCKQLGQLAVFASRLWTSKFEVPRKRTSLFGINRKITTANLDLEAHQSGKVFALKKDDHNGRMIFNRVLENRKRES